MTSERLRVGVLAGLAVTTVVVITVVARTGADQQEASLSVMVDGLTDGMRAVDRLGLMATRVSLESEIAVGNTLAHEVESAWSAGPRADEAYVSAVLAELTSAGGLRRPDMPYRARLVDSPLANAYAVPGGHVYVTTAMLQLLESEAELAAILGHEVAHVDLGHCIERLQYELAAREVGGRALEAVVGLSARLWMQGYSSELESEADRQSVVYAHRAGYHPEGGKLVFARLQRMHGGAETAATSIPAEVRGMAAGALADYFGSHPSPAERIAGYERFLRENGIDPRTRAYYLGSQNLQRRVPRAAAELPGEWVTGRLGL